MQSDGPLLLHTTSGGDGCDGEGGGGPSTGGGKCPDYIKPCRQMENLAVAKDQQKGFDSRQ